MKRLGPAAGSAALLLLAGCMVGPRYHRPDVATAPAYKEPAPASWQGTDGWKNAQPQDQSLRGKWWEIFGDPQLNTLEEQVTASNQDLKVAEAHYREARAMVRFSRAGEAPTIGTAPSITNERLSPNRPYFSQTAANNGTGDFVLPVDLSWEIDLWGKIRREVTASREEAQASAADLQTASLSLHAELAIDYFELRSADAQKQLLDQTVKDYEDALRLTTNRFEGGASPKSDVAQAQTQLDAAQVQDTDIGVQRAQFEHAVAILIGKPPAQFSLALTPLHAEPPVIPAGVPSELLQRRPDIAASERRMGEANEQIGIARSAYFPDLTLSAEGGFEGTTIANWMNWPSRFWAVGPTLAQTIFDGGRRRATSESALAGYDAAVATYRQTSLTAFMEVEDNLAALRVLEQEAQQQNQATASAQESLQLFDNRYEGGVDNYLQVITAQTTYLANERNSIDIMRRRMDSSVLLIKALGGGWDTSQLPKL
ncbi:efflux transporter outer membrane subunit [Paracidobacterium acidisoli]|uniref:Efflux transporter outer membrane subunit n=1 Tax=Paracidobacterium acidisoli TaxID=2303751 RepID=A0A372IT61_9BACT|nr:efflux transporter outer membrane subunit [Paracidobacterium acidisoli]MBT9329507.1 efflux transporter outer membrane subunit [Paracidobacterium acidisoli]